MKGLRRLAMENTPAIVLLMIGVGLALTGLEASEETIEGFRQWAIDTWPGIAVLVGCTLYGIGCGMLIERDTGKSFKSEEAD